MYVLCSSELCNSHYFKESLVLALCTLVKLPTIVDTNMAVGSDCIGSETVGQHGGSL